MGVGPVGFDVEQQALIWAMWRRGDAIREMERTLGETLPRIRRYLRRGHRRTRYRAFMAGTVPITLGGTG